MDYILSLLIIKCTSKLNWYFSFEKADLFFQIKVQQFTLFVVQPVKVTNHVCAVLCSVCNLCNSSLTIVTWSPQTRVRSGLQAAGVTALPPPAWAAEMAFPMSHRETAEWPARSDKTKNKHTSQHNHHVPCNRGSSTDYLLKKQALKRESHFIDHF